MEIIQGNFPHRDSQISLLWNLLKIGQGIEAIHIFGFPGTGKTAVVRSLLERIEIPKIYIDCHESSSTKQLYTRILSDLVQLEVNDERPSKKRRQKKVEIVECRSGGDFVDQFQEIRESRFPSYKSSIICVLDNVERVRQFSDGDPLTVLCRLSEYLNRKLYWTLVTISELPWSKLFYCGRFSYSAVPVQIPFPGYSLNELTDILIKLKTSDGGSEEAGYRAFVENVLKIFYSSCRDVLELDHQIQTLWTECGRPENYKLKSKWKQIQTTGMENVDKLFLRNSTSQGQMCKTSKFLLVAAYFASYNPKASDKRFFLKYHGKEQVKTPSTRRKASLHTLVGPKSFSLQRLVTIFRCLAKDDSNLLGIDGLAVNDRLMTQIRTLVTDRLLQSVSSNAMLGVPKYRCIADFDFVDEIARSIGIEMKPRLAHVVRENN